MSHVGQEELEEPESRPVSEGHGDNGTDLALGEEGDELDSEGGLGIEELGAEVVSLLQLIGLQNSGTGPRSSIQACQTSLRLHLKLQIRIYWLGPDQ